MKIEKKKPHLEKSSELKVDENENFCFSLEQHDRNQGQSFAEWEKDGLLSKAMEVLISLGNEVKVMRQPSLTLRKARGEKARFLSRAIAMSAKLNSKR